ncbi:MAG TPA: glutamate--cysteine ligase [Mycobacteriales bacterium]
MTVRSVGVEEEFLLCDPERSRILSLAPRVVHGQDDLEKELTRQQVETGTDPVRSLGDLRAELVRMRRTAADAAAAEGATVVALGTSPVPVTPATTPNLRYERMIAEFGRTGRQQLTCGCHVHVGVSSRDEAVGAMNRIQPWLPGLLAVAANSPFWNGEDSGYASYRTQVWDRWPSAGPIAPVASAAEYEELVESLIRAGVMLDRGMVYFDARPSDKYSTLELRVADVCLAVDDAVLVAALARALVSTGAGEWERDEPVPTVRPELVRAARWQASRAGLGGKLVDPSTSRPVPARDVLDALVVHIRPALEDTGDLEVVAEGLDRVFARGTGAQRQLAACERLGPDGLLAYAAEETLAGCS